MTSAQILDVIFSFISCLTVDLTLCYILGNKKIYKFAAHLFSLISLVFYYLCTYSPSFEKIITSPSLRQALRTASIQLMIILFVFLFKGPVKKKLQAYAVVVLSIFLSEITISIIYMFVLKLTSEDAKNLDFVSKLIYISITYLLYLVACFISYKICTRHQTNQPIKNVVAFVVILFCSCFTIVLFIATIMNSTDLFSKIAVLGSIICFVITMIVVYRILKQLNEKELLKEKIYWLEQIQSLESNYYSQLDDKTQEIRKIRHDFNDQLISIQLLMKENTNESMDAATELLENLNREIQSTKINIYTDNILVNTIIDSKVREAEKSGITVNAQIKIPSKIESIDSSDLNCVFINLLNNAITACSDLSNDSDKIIEIKAAVKGNYLIVKTVNPYVEILTDEKGKLITTKEDKTNHGLGILILENIVKKYNGKFEASTSEQEFTSIAMLEIS